MASAFLYGKIDEEVYVSQPPSFQDPKSPQKVYKVVKALYGLHQAPKSLGMPLYHVFGEDMDTEEVQSTKPLLFKSLQRPSLSARSKEFLEAEYVAAANCCGQVLWIQNQMDGTNEEQPDHSPKSLTQEPFTHLLFPIQFPVPTGGIRRSLSNDLILQGIEDCNDPPNCLLTFISKGDLKGARTTKEETSKKKQGYAAKLSFPKTREEGMQKAMVKAKGNAQKSVPTDQNLVLTHFKLVWMSKESTDDQVDASQRSLRQGIEADRILAAKLKSKKREQFTIEEKS
ncbi:putative ribonuclease H-like domain-containing protein [Tanacetum coccineum]